VTNQAVGSLVQGTSRALFEEVSFDTRAVTSLDWATYPILRFKDSPKITFEFIRRKDIPPRARGSNCRTAARRRRARPRKASTWAARGEPPPTSVAAAIANAFFDATGVRIRTAPMTPARVRNYLRAAGI
jgi:CO/xanthine dehydrogenase Mo-binding subunit